MRKIDLIVLHCSATRTDRCYTEYGLITDHLRRGAPVQAITIIYVRTEASRASVPLINPVRMPVATYSLPIFEYLVTYISIFASD